MQLSSSKRLSLSMDNCTEKGYRNAQQWDISFRLLLFRLPISPFFPAASSAVSQKKIFGGGVGRKQIDRTTETRNCKAAKTTSKQEGKKRCLDANPLHRSSSSSASATDRHFPSQLLDLARTKGPPIQQETSLFPAFVNVDSRRSG